MTLEMATKELKKEIRQCKHEARARAAFGWLRKQTATCPSFLPEFLPAHLDVALRHDEGSDKILQQHGSSTPPPRADPDYAAQRGSRGPFKNEEEVA